MEWSPRMPLLMEPTIAMAPTQYTSDAVTKPLLTLPCPLASEPILRSANCPSWSSRLSMPSALPSSPPTAMEMTMHMVPFTLREPSAFAVSTASNVPLMPMKITASPSACITAERRRSGSPLRSRRPSAQPARINTTLMSVPIMRRTILCRKVVAYCIQSECLQENRLSECAYTRTGDR